MRPGQVHHADARGDQRRAALGAGQQRADLGGVAGVVEQDEDAAAVEQRAVQRRPFVEGVGDRGVGGAQRPQEGAEDGLRLGGAGAGALEVDVELPVRERAPRLVRHVHGEGGLADAADAGQRRDGHHPAARVGRGEHLAQFGDEGRAAGEVGHGRRELGRAHGGGGRFRLGRGGFGEGGVGAQDALLELAQSGARLDAELLGEQPAGVRVDRERLGLPAAAVQRQHEQFAQPLAQRVRGGQRGELGDGLAVAALLQVHVETGLQVLQPPLLQPGALGLGVGAGHVREGLAVPQRQRLVEQRAGPPQVPGAPRLLGVGDEFLGAQQVQLVALGQPQGVTAGLAVQHLGAEGLAQP